MKLIVGLGNLGRTYRYSRHNIGFLVVDRLAKGYKIKIKLDTTTRSHRGRGSIEDKEIILAKPRCFMNLSGQSVSLLVKKYGLNSQDILVVFDDLDLDWGKIRIRPIGGSGGHKGMESIIKTLRSSDFARLRFGIGRPKQKLEVANYVLRKWTQREKKDLGDYLERAADCCKTWVVSGISKAMNKFN